MLQTISIRCCNLISLVWQRTDPSIFFDYPGFILNQEKNMKSPHAISLLMLIATTVLGGCASNIPQQTSTPYSTPYSNSSQPSNSYGAIESIQATRTSNTNSGAGVVVGGLVGGLLGNQIGSGNGRTAATVVGAVGGAMVGNNVEQNRTLQGPDAYQIRVRLDSGNSTTVVQESVYEMRVGDRVRIVDSRAYRY
jgi:outer membrane lipoprotein SlyB